jgi:hypothetical protein
VLAALTIAPAQYTAHVADCQQVSQQTFAAGLTSEHPDRYHQFQYLAVRVHDQFGEPIPDYVVEFYQEDDDDADDVFTAIHSDILVKVTKNSVDPSYRSFLFDLDLLDAFLVTHPDAQIEMSVSAASISERIRYRNPQRGVSLFTGPGQKLRRPNSPLLIDITLYRDSAADVFKFARFV